jgi:hypothetical protein
MIPAAMTRHAALIMCLAALMACAPSSQASVSPSSTPPQASPPSTPKYPDSSCRQEATSRSLNSNTATSFTLTNHTSKTLTLFWLNFQGQRVSYGDVAAGGTKDQGTYLTHPWVVADPAGHCLLLFLVTDPVKITVG